MQRTIQIKNGQLVVSQHNLDYISSFKDGVYPWEIRKQKSKASNPMYGYLFGYVYIEIVKASGAIPNKLEIDYVHSELKKRFGVNEVVEKVKYQKKKLVYYKEIEPKSLSKYTVEEMQDYWTSLQGMAAQVFGIEIRDPDSDWKKKWTESHPEQSIEKKVLDTFEGEIE